MNSPALENATHTPGPWKWRNEPYADGKPYIHVTAGAGYFHGENPGFGISGILSEADGMLIAASPDLLKACEAAIADHDNCGDLQQSTLDMLRAAIISARGRPPSEQPKELEAWEIGL